MKLERFFAGIVSCDLYYTYLRDKINTTFYVEQKFDKLLVFDKNGDLYWMAEYLENEDAYAIINNWCKTSDCWSIRDKVDYAQRLRVNDILKGNLGFMDMVD